MTEQELKDLFELLRSQGWEPQLCDTPVPYYDSRVPCGLPDEVIDVVPEGYMLLPHNVPGVDVMFSLSVRGDSMKDVGIDDGDKVDVMATPVANDGDIVVAMVDGECTVKVFFTDSFGRHWLVPCNKKYEPILMEKYDRACISGVVVAIHKGVPHVHYRELNYAVSSSPDYMKVRKVSKAERMEHAVRSVASMVKQKRQWYAVYRALKDKRMLEDDSFATFTKMVSAFVPDHSYLPSKVELGRMDVQSFRRPVDQWVDTDAPVTGIRFEAYMSIARATFDALESS